MSKSFVQSFFPSIASYASSPERAPAFVVYLWQVALPEKCEQLYYYHNDREVSSALKTILQLQRPCLAMAAALGAYIGLNGRIDESERNNAHRRNDLLLMVRTNPILSSRTVPTSISYNSTTYATSVVTSDTVNLKHTNITKSSPNCRRNHTLTT